MKNIFELYQPNIMVNPYTFYKEYQPSSKLSPYVACYWCSTPSYNSLNTKEAPEIFSNTVIPDGCTDLIFEYDVHSNKLLVLYCGIFEEYFSFYERINENKLTFGIRFFPGQSTYFIKAKARETSSRVINIEEIQNDVLITTLKDIFQTTSNFTEIIYQFDQALISSLHNNLNIYINEELLMNVLHYILENNGAVSVQSISDKEAVGRRRLNRLFEQRIGLSPKKFTQVIRFQASLSSWLENSVSSSTYLNHDLNYYDQSHFIKEIKKHMGRLPSNIQPSDFYNTNLSTTNKIKV